MMGWNARNEGHATEERWAGGDGHEKGSLDELRGMQAAGLGFTMTPTTSPAVDVNREALALIYEVPVAQDSRREERCQDGGFMKQIVNDVVKEAGSSSVSEGKNLESIVREVLHALAKRSMCIPGSGGASILLPESRFGVRAHEHNLDGEDWLKTTAQHLEYEEDNHSTPNFRNAHTGRAGKEIGRYESVVEERNTGRSGGGVMTESQQPPHSADPRGSGRKMCRPSNSESEDSLSAGEDFMNEDLDDETSEEEVPVRQGKRKKLGSQKTVSQETDEVRNEISRGKKAEARRGGMRKIADSHEKQKKKPNKKTGKKEKDSTMECKITNTGEPIGKFWTQMRHYAYSYAPRYFPWHLKWSEQDKRMKNSFVRKLETKFGGGWNDSPVMQAISKLMRRKRHWARSLIRAEGGKATKPVACSLPSWEALIAQEALTHSDSTFLRARKAVKARMEKKAFHHLGTCGVKGTYAKFFERFGRQMTTTEMELAKKIGWEKLLRTIVTKNTVMIESDGSDILAGAAQSNEIEGGDPSAASNQHEACRNEQ